MPSVPGLAPLEQTPEMKLALKNYIIRQRKKQQEEAEMSAALHQERREREERQQRDSATLEDTKKQIDDLRKKMADLSQEKHEIFTQLKKVLNQEEESRKRKEKIKMQHEREAREILSKVGPAPALPPALAGMMGGPGPSVGVPPPPPPKKMMATAAAYPPVPMIQVSHAKRQRSPSPPVRGPQAGANPVSSPYSYSSPKHLISSPYRSPNQQPYLGPPPAKIPAQGAYSSPHSGAFPGGASMGGTLPPPPPPPRLTGQQVAAGGIPVIPQQKQIGGITSGFPLHKPVMQTQQKPQMYGHGNRNLFGGQGGSGMLR